MKKQGVEKGKKSIMGKRNTLRSKPVFFHAGNRLSGYPPSGGGEITKVGLKSAMQFLGVGHDYKGEKTKKPNQKLPPHCKNQVFDFFRPAAPLCSLNNLKKAFCARPFLQQVSYFFFDFSSSFQISGGLLKTSDTSVRKELFFHRVHAASIPDSFLLLYCQSAGYLFSRGFQKFGDRIRVMPAFN